MSAPAASAASVAVTPNTLPEVADAHDASESSPSATDEPAIGPSDPPTKANGAKKTKKANTVKKPRGVKAIVTDCGPWPRPYYFEEGFRKVAPYFWTYNTFCKERWIGRELMDVFDSEFRDRPAEYYHRAMADGTVAVNGKAVGPSYVLRNGDLVSHTLHRHEPPVTEEPVRILHEDEGMLVIIKPSGIPVHPAGRYGFNSIQEILKDQRGRDFVPRPCHRLDRLTSGIMFIAKDPESAGALSQQIRQRTVRKEYVARVMGEFPDGEIVCDQPILQISPKLGLNRVRANGKSARTVFKRLAYYAPQETPREAAAQDGAQGEERIKTDSEPGAEKKALPWARKKGYSIVRCLPVTGRTHQIRVHLQFLGHPIQNDPIYANQNVWGFDLGSGDMDGTENNDEDIISRLERMGKEEAADAVAYHDEVVDQWHKKRNERLSGELCSVCDTPLYTDPGHQELSLWLHSLRYEDAGGSWSYVTPLPSWALPPEGVEGPTEVGGMDALVEAIKAENPEIAGRD